MQAFEGGRDIQSGDYPGGCALSYANFYGRTLQQAQGAPFVLLR
jgi:hypothetical protein